MRLLDRYVLRQFLQAYLYCIISFISIWLIFDLSESISNILEQRLPPGRIAQYYLLQAPQIIVVLLPVSLLLALLFSLGKMSRANEIVSMLAAGISVPRILLPLFAAGLVSTVVSGVLNYSLAPQAENVRRDFLDAAPSRRDQVGLRAQIFRNRSDHRTWFIQHYKPGGNEFSSLQILQQDAQDNIVRAYFATRAFYRPETREWELQLGKKVEYDEAGSITGEEVFPSLLLREWSETPFRLMSAHLKAESLSVPELRQYLRFNADFPQPLLAPYRTHLHYRFALPWSCLIVVFIAGPLAIGFSRRGVLSSVGAAILLVFAMNFLGFFFLALGEGHRIPAWTAAWAPNVIFTLLGLYLLYLRSTNRDWPQFKPAASRVMVSP